MRRYETMNEKALRKHVGGMGQIAQVRTAVLDDGKGRGVRVADMRNGSGIEFSVLLDRGMDIGQASFKGVPLAFVTPVGYSHPAYYEPEGLRWLRNWHAGLLTGCGLRNVGSPQQTDPMAVAGPMGLHGRLSNTPAEKCAVEEEFVNGAYTLSVRGTVRETSMFGENLELVRTISTALGRNTISVRDRVTNRGFQASPLMVLYHINLGFPLLDETARLKARPHKLAPRTNEAKAGLSAWNHAQAPAAGYTEQCFYHDIPADGDGLARMRLENRGLKLAVEVAYRKAELPFFTQWKMMGEQTYVMGLEPGNCHCDGQQKEREGGTLREIWPGETVEFLVEVSALEL